MLFLRQPLALLAMSAVARSVSAKPTDTVSAWILSAEGYTGRLAGAAANGPCSILCFLTCTDPTVCDGVTDVSCNQNLDAHTHSQVYMLMFSTEVNNPRYDLVQRGLPHT